MAGIVFPDLAGSLIPAMGMRRQMEEDERQRAVGQFIPGALAGDTTAFGKVAELSPQHAIAIQGHLERLDTQKRAQLKDELEVSAKSAAGILSLPEAEQPAAYEATYRALKAAGYQLNDLPPTWDPTVKPRLQAAAVRSGEYLKLMEKQPIGLGSAGAAPAASGSPVSSVDQQQFIQTMMPHALTAAEATGLDPRLILAQTALETGYGKAAPGNNYFGIKGPGQVLGTTEASPGGGTFATRDSFRAYGSPGESAADYAKLLKTNPRYAQVLQAQGLDAQIEAMGKSGYATDPNYAAKLRQIATGIQLAAPGGGTFAGGQPAIPGAPPAAPGAPQQPASPVPTELRAWVQQHYPGHLIMGDRQTGMPLYDHQGRLFTRDPQGQPRYLDVPKPNDQPKSLEERDRETLLTGDPSTPQYAAAYAHLGADRVTVDPTTGTLTTIKPDMSWARKPSFTVAGGAQPQPAPAEPGSRSVTVTPGHGRPIPGTENETISKNVAAIGSIDKALDIMRNPSATAQPSGRIAGALSRNLGQGGDLIAQEIDPGGVKARALLADVNSQLLLARSGAAVTEGEFKRLVALLPSASDRPEVIVQKLEQVRSTYADILKGQASQYTRENGFIPHEGAQRILSGPAASSAQTPPVPQGAIKEGSTATNPKTGEKIIYRNGQWTPLQ